MTLEWMLGWWNLIFILPFGLALLYFFLYAASGLTFGEADADADLNHDAAFDHDADLTEGDVNVDADIEHDVAVDHGADAGDAGSIDVDHDHDAGAGRGALHWLGVGRVPLSILLMVLLLAWGASGFLANQLLRDTFVAEARIALLSIPIALLVSLTVTRWVVRGIERWIPLDETTARRRHDLLGLAGVAMYDISDRFGMLSVRDDRGELYQVPCRTAAGHPPLAKNARAVLVSFNARERLFHVIPAEAVNKSPQPAPVVPAGVEEAHAGGAP